MIKDPIKRKEYNKQYHKEWYKRNADSVKKRAIENTLKYRIRNKEFVNNYKSEKGCAECGFNRHFTALDFHHHSADKEFTIARMVQSGHAIGKIKKEIKKCTLLCANCHRIHHYNDRLL